jgi:hypothetical protein
MYRAFYRLKTTCGRRNTAVVYGQAGFLLLEFIPV